MAPSYRQLLNKIRLAFPQPVSDRVHDSYFVHSTMRALDRVDEMKSELPLLGSQVPADYGEARRAALAVHGKTLEEVTADLTGYLSGLTIFGHPRMQQNVVTQPSKLQTTANYPAKPAPTTGLEAAVTVQNSALLQAAMELHASTALDDHIWSMLPAERDWAANYWAL